MSGTKILRLTYRIPPNQYRCCGGSENQAAMMGVFVTGSKVRMLLLKQRQQCRRLVHARRFAIAYQIIAPSGARAVKSSGQGN